MASFQKGWKLSSYLMNGIVILTPQSREKNLAIYLVFVREFPRSLGMTIPRSVFMRRPLLTLIGRLIGS